MTIYIVCYWVLMRDLWWQCLSKYSTKYHPSNANSFGHRLNGNNNYAIVLVIICVGIIYGNVLFIIVFTYYLATTNCRALDNENRYIMYIDTNIYCCWEVHHLQATYNILWCYHTSHTVYIYIIHIYKSGD